MADSSANQPLSMPNTAAGFPPALAAPFTIPWRDLGPSLKRVGQKRFVIPLILLEALSCCMVGLFGQKLPFGMVFGGSAIIWAIVSLATFALLGYCFQQGRAANTIFTPAKSKNIWGLMQGGLLLYFLVGGAIVAGFFLLTTISNLLGAHLPKSTSNLVAAISIGSSFVFVVGLFLWRLDFFCSLIFALWSTNRPAAIFSASLRQQSLHGLKRKDCFQLLVVCILLTLAIQLVSGLSTAPTMMSTLVPTTSAPAAKGTFFLVFGTALFITSVFATYVYGAFCYWLGRIMHDRRHAAPERYPGLQGGGLK